MIHQKSRFNTNYNLRITQIITYVLNSVKFQINDKLIFPPLKLYTIFHHYQDQINLVLDVLSFLAAP